jgi:hypothetical protein
MFFSNDVIKYMCIILINEGVYVPPPSIIKIIGPTMKKMISKGTADQWVPVLRQYKKFVNMQPKDVGESLVDVQAKRVLKAESASLAYG